MHYVSFLSKYLFQKVCNLSPRDNEVEYEICYVRGFPRNRTFQRYCLATDAIVAVALVSFDSILFRLHISCRCRPIFVYAIRTQFSTSRYLSGKIPAYNIKFPRSTKYLGTLFRISDVAFSAVMTTTVTQRQEQATHPARGAGRLEPITGVVGGRLVPRGRHGNGRSHRWCLRRPNHAPEAQR